MPNYHKGEIAGLARALNEFRRNIFLFLNLRRVGFPTSVVFPFKGWLLFATLLTGGPAGAAELYWDTNGTTPGAGATVNGT